MMYPEGEADVVDLSARHFLRPLHQLVRTDEPLGAPVVANGTTPVIGALLWHDCRALEESSWHIVMPAAEADLIECPIAGCGDRGRIRNAQWEAVA